MDLQELQSREIFTQRICRLLRERFKSEMDATLRDLCDAAYDIVQEDKKNENPK